MITRRPGRGSLKFTSNNNSEPGAAHPTRGEGENMDNRKALNTLSELEEFFYYLKQNPEGLNYSDVEKIHNAINTALIEWHRLTGLTID